MEKKERAHKLSFRKLMAFTLAEMMVVMLVLSIVLAASMPLITKKSSVEGGPSIWRYVPADRTHIYWGLTKGSSAMIGTKTPPDKTAAPTAYNSKLYINVPETEDVASYPHISFGVNGTPTGFYSVSKNQSIAAGTGTTKATGQYSIAMGVNTSAQGLRSTAIGTDANATQEYSGAFGWGASSTTRGMLTIGVPKLPDGSNQIVYIPGRVYIGASAGGTRTLNIRADGVVTGSGAVAAVLSDKRVKNIIEDYKISLNSIKQLKIYKYNFKENEMVEKYKKELWADKDSPLCPDKRPAQFKKCVNQKAEEYRKDAKARGEFSNSHVGIVAQDLEKVFPNSVRTDKNGYMEIETGEIFYAMINSIQELDNKIQMLTNSKELQEVIDGVKKIYVTREEYDKKMEILKMHLYVFKNYVDKNIKEKLKVLEQQYNELKRDFDGMKKEMVSFKGKLQNLEKQSREDNKNVMKRINALEKENRELRRRIENLERKVK